MNEVEEKHKTNVNNVSKESQAFHVIELKRHRLVLLYQGQKVDFIAKLPDNIKTDVPFKVNN